MNKLKLSIASTDYDHFRDFRTGDVRAEGIDHSWSMLGHHEVFARFTANREWDVAELSFAKFSAQITRDEWQAANLGSGAFTATDSNSDGVVTAWEVKDHAKKAGTLDKMFTKLDTTGDGSLSRVEAGDLNMRPR